MALSTVLRAPVYSVFDGLSTRVSIGFEEEFKHEGRIHWKTETMGEWIPFAEGRYLAQRAILLAVDDRAVELEDAIIQVSEGPGGRKRLSGRGRAPNALMVELLEAGQELDLLLDLGGEFKYRLRAPGIQGGKVFAPGVKSFVQFIPQAPWEPLTEADFDSLVTRVRILSDRRS